MNIHSLEVITLKEIQDVFMAIHERKMHNVSVAEANIILICHPIPFREQIKLLSVVLQTATRVNTDSIVIDESHLMKAS